MSDFIVLIFEQIRPSLESYSVAFNSAPLSVCFYDNIITVNVNYYISTMCLSFGTNISHHVFSLETLQMDVYVVLVICLCNKRISFW